MKNLFDSENYAETEPAVLVAGDRWAWKRTDLGEAYAPSLYGLTYSFRLEGSSGTSSVEIEATASESGTEYVIEIASATTAAYNVGTYQWQAYITRTSDGERVAVGSGTFEVVADRAEDTSDPRTHAKKMLDYIEAALENRATNYQLDILSYSFGSRDATRNPELLRKWRSHYRAEVNGELAQENVKNGKRDGSLVVTRMRG